MSNTGNGGNPPEETQIEMEIEDTPEVTPEINAPPLVAEGTVKVVGGLSAETTQEKPVVMELTNTADGCWKILAGGERVEITPAEWRRELAHQFSRSPAKEQTQE